MRTLWLSPVLVVLAVSACGGTPGPIDAGTPSETEDAGVVSPDAGELDASVPDAGADDAGAVDAGAIDAGGLDAGAVDAGGVDAGGVDAGSVDAGAPDAGPMCAGGCDDANPCTDDACQANGCTHAPRTGATCDDGSLTTFSDTCSATGVCAGQPVTCPTNTACLAYTPDGTATCVSSPRVGSTCDDSNPATADDRCTMAATCVGQPVTCPMNTVCLAYTPNGTATCTATPQVGATCDDQSLTTADDRCTIAGACAGQTIVCPADTTCQRFTPNGTTTCTATAQTGTVCDDASASTSDDRCTSAGTCAGTPVVCPTNTACTTYTPNGTATCTSTFNNGASCEDTNACTPTGSCNAGSCVVGPPVTCTNGGTCANGGCSCPAGWTGPTCATDVNECASFACGGASTCTNSAGSYSCQCLTNYSSPTGANCTSTTSVLEVVVFYDESIVRKYGPDAEQRIAALVARSKTLFDGSLRPPQLTLSLNAIIRLSPLPSTIQQRACNTLVPSTSCVGCYSGGSSGNCGTLLSNLATEIDTEQLLSSFASFVTARRSTITTQSGGLDVAVLLTDADFASSTTGLAYVSGACRTSNNAVVSTANAASDDTVATIFAHELGHTLGMSHDGSSGNIMSASVGSPLPTTFSAGSITQYQAWLSGLGSQSCVGDAAGFDWMTRRCGNGVIDLGESCDPAVLSDTCCSNTCQLQPGCSCGNTEPCCVNGTPATAGTSCRVARGQCDLADTCDGQTGACLDTVVTPRTACSPVGYCLRGTCASRGVQCSTLGQQSGLTLTSCETSTRCDRLDCSQSPSTCNLFYTSPLPADGSQCGLLNQCVSGVCVPSAALKDYVWVPNAWSTCSGGTSVRTLRCVDESGTAASSTLCDPDTRPATSRTCL